MTGENLPLHVSVQKKRIGLIANLARGIRDLYALICLTHLREGRVAEETPHEMTGKKEHLRMIYIK